MRSWKIFAVEGSGCIAKRSKHQSGVNIFHAFVERVMHVTKTNRQGIKIGTMPIPSFSSLAKISSCASVASPEQPKRDESSSRLPDGDEPETVLPEDSPNDYMPTLNEPSRTSLRSQPYSSSPWMK